VCAFHHAIVQLTFCIRDLGDAMTKKTTTALVAAVCCLAAGCADGGILGSSVTTSSVDPNAAKLAAAPAKPDPACVALLAKIDTIRKDGVTERVEKVAAGKSSTVPVKRASLAQMTELAKANADYQVKCSAPGLKPATIAAPVAAPVAPIAAAPVEKVAKKTAAVIAKPVAVAPAMAKPIVTPIVSAPAVAVAAPAIPDAVVLAPAPAQVAAPVAAQVSPLPAIPGVSVSGGQ
jgi:hypothetical protein